MTNESTQVKTCDCAAHGCPMLGSNTRSTTGTTEWYCFIHFGADAKNWQQISAELNRLNWLVDIVRGLRALPIKKNWLELEAEARKVIALSQRGDLQMNDREGPISWMIRLEGVLAQSCKDSIANDKEIA